MEGGQSAAGAEFEGARIEAPKLGIPSPEKFLILALNMMDGGEFWVKFFTVQLPVLHAIVSWQLHISLTRTAQIYLELHFCVELHTKKSSVGEVSRQRR